MHRFQENWNQLRRYFDFYRRAQTKYDIHSPLVHSFIEKVLQDKRNFYRLSRVQRFHRLLSQQKKLLPTSPFGAGSKVITGPSAPLSQHLNAAGCPGSTGALFFRLAAWQKPQMILELGTHLGLSSAYLSSGRPSAQLVTVEGHIAFAQLAQRHLSQLDLVNAQVVLADFDSFLTKDLEKLPPIQLLHLDGDHRKETTLKRVRQLLPAMDPNGILILGDIYWSKGMMDAWNELKSWKEINLSIDLFRMGLIFLGNGRIEKEHYRIVPYRRKPWRLGFFPKLANQA